MRFRPRLWPTVVTVAASCLLIALGFWQLDRAAQKRQRHALFVERSVSPAVVLGGAAPDTRIERLIWRPVRARGRYRDLHVLLDNRVRRGLAGYEVFTVFRLDQDADVLVGRGWIAAPPRREVVPAVPVVAGTVEISGHVAPPPAPGLRLGLAADAHETLTDHVIRVQQLDPETLNERYGFTLPPFVILLDDTAAGGFDRAWPEPGNEAQRHVAYAVQWFGLAGVLGIVYVALSLNDRGRHDAR